MSIPASGVGVSVASCSTTDVSIDQRLNGIEPSLIGDGATLGTPVRIGGYALLGLVLDAGWDTNVITFQTSFDYLDDPDETQATWHNIYLDSANTELQIAATVAVASRAICMDTVLNKLAAFNWIRPRSGTSASPAAQTGDTVLTFLTKA